MKRLFASLLVAIPMVPCAAHDVWLAAQPPGPAGETVALQLLLGGGGGELESMPFDPARVERFWHVSAHGERPIDLPAATAAVRIAPAPGGTTSVGYVSTPALSELAPERFAAYLREEHLDRALALWQQSAATRAAPVREHFSRSLKALLGAGEAPLVDCPLGLPLELSLQSASATEVVVRATFSGEPAPDVWVELTQAQGELLAAQATDSRGEVRLARPAGSAVLRATHIQPDSGGDVAWRSWWASTTFTPTAAGVAACDEATAGRARAAAP